MCGEKLAPPPPHIPLTGSPPHVRGKAMCYVGDVAVFGITPACAGKSDIITADGTGYTDHPRMCGEKYQRRRTFSGYGGSPPHVRGKARYLAGFVCRHGITPACAGKSASPARGRICK